MNNVFQEIHNQLKELKQALEKANIPAIVEIVLGDDGPYLTIGVKFSDFKSSYELEPFLSKYNATFKMI